MSRRRCAGCGKPLPWTASASRRFCSDRCSRIEAGTYSGHPERARNYGITATLVDTTTGATEVLVARGSPRLDDATLTIAARCDELGPTWRVRTLSTPRTILADLRNAGAERGEKQTRPESVLLGKVGRMDLVERPTNLDGLRVEAISRRKRRR